MKIFLKVLAWLGVVAFLFLITLAFIQSFISITIDSGKGGALFWGPEIAFVSSFIALIPMLIGGIMGKPKYFWIACIITGSLYILSLFYFYSYLPDRIEHGHVYEIFKDLIFCLLPGLVAILEGIWLRRKTIIPTNKQVFDGAI
ncbi:MAG: hypothetical protein PHF74_03560 [Dehalococcoidales bacterium]|nr:hypothetical protein [Dehalococcoidales bacterium]